MTKIIKKIEQVEFILSFSQSKSAINVVVRMNKTCMRMKFDVHSKCVFNEIGFEIDSTVASNV